MRADQYVDFARFDALQNRLLLLRGAEARDHFDRDRELLEAFFECLEMLEAQHGGRRQHRDLPAILNRFECGAHGHFCLSVADVAHQQTIHRQGRFHIALDVGDGRQLVVGLVVVEGVFKLALKFIVRRKRMTRARLCAGRRASAVRPPCPAWPCARALWSLPIAGCPAD